MSGEVQTVVFRECSRCGAQHDAAEGCIPYAQRVKGIRRELEEARATIKRLEKRIRADHIPELEKTILDQARDIEAFRYKCETLQTEVDLADNDASILAEQKRALEFENERLRDLLNSVKQRIEGLAADIAFENSPSDV